MTVRIVLADAPVPLRTMNISVRWLNQYLQPGNLTADEAERVLTFAGFPIESATPLPDTGHGPDTLLDVEVTSNRGDVLCHFGVAREVAALTGRALIDPRSASPQSDGPDSDGAPSESLREAVSLDNQAGAGGACPLFTARVIRGVKVGPSPAWMVRTLESIGQRSINNVVDVTNFVAFELGQPTHVFDLGTLTAGTGGSRRLLIRTAHKGEKLPLLDGRTIALAGDEIVVCDGELGDRALGGSAISLAGIMGGATTQVTQRTTDVLLEAATWFPAAVRRAARRFQIRTDASYRFERTVDARTIEPAARRAADLIVQTAGGTLLPGVLHAPGSHPSPAHRPRTVFDLRPARCAAILGITVPTPEIVRILRAHEIDAREGDPLRCTIPPHRPDLEREIDLIEEVARTHGLDRLPVHDRVPIRVSPPQPDERAVGELTGVLTGLGFYETVTFTFVSHAMARPFLPPGLELLHVQDERRKADPILRPSAIPSLLACRRANQHAGVTGDGAAAQGGGVRLFEISSAFAQSPGAAAGEGGVERVNLALLADAALPAGGKPHDQLQHTLRIVRGAVEALVAALGGPDARDAAELTPAPPPVPAYDQRGFASVDLRGRRIGLLGVIAPALLREYDLQTPVVACELNLHDLIALYPPAPTGRIGVLPAFPAIDRDLSLIVGEQVGWARVHALVAAARVPLLEEAAFVGVYRGRPIEPGKKSVTLRLRFRDPARTLRHEEVDPQVNTIIDLARQQLAAEVRTA